MSGFSENNWLSIVVANDREHYKLEPVYKFSNNRAFYDLSTISPAQEADVTLGGEEATWQGGDVEW